LAAAAGFLTFGNRTYVRRAGRMGGPENAMVREVCDKHPQDKKT
jgi:hypothetical protein